MIMMCETKSEDMKNLTSIQEALNAQGKELETVTNDKDGNITFKPLSFDKLGTYTYTVSEVNSHDEDTIYDTMVANVK